MINTKQHNETKKKIRATRDLNPQLLAPKASTLPLELATQNFFFWLDVLTLEKEVILFSFFGINYVLE